MTKKKAKSQGTRQTVEMWPVPIDDGWDVRMEPQTGLIACGNLQLSVVDPVAYTIRRVVNEPARLLRWLRSDRVVWQTSTGPDTAELWTAPVSNLAARSMAPLDPAGVCGNTFAAANNNWSSWLSNGLRLSAGTLTTVGPVLTGVYENQMAGDWLVTSRDQGGMVIVWLKQTRGQFNDQTASWVVVSESGPLSYPQYWLSPGGIVGVGYYGDAALIWPGEQQATEVTCRPGSPEGIPRVVTVDGVAYVVTASYDAEQQPVLYCRTLEVALDPFRRTREIATVRLPFGFIQFDGRGHHGRLEIAGNDAKGHLAWLSIDVKALPVGPVGPVIDPEPPEPPLIKPPVVTITDYQPRVGEAPLEVHAIWGKSEGSGPVESVQWQYSMQGDVWTTDATNDASDPDHTYHFRAEGEYFLRLMATGPGGTATTGAERKITVTAAPVPPEPPMPNPDMLQTVAFRLPSGSLLCADQQQANVVNATRTEIGAWESFLVEPHPVGGAWVAFRSDTGYVCAQASGHQLSADGTVVEALALRIIELGGGGVALMASDGFYLWAEDGGGGVVLRNGSRIDSFSTFAPMPGVEKEKPVAPEPPDVVVVGDAKADINTNFLALEGYGYIFMLFGDPIDKFEKILDRLREKGHTHVPTGIWGSYPGLSSFNYRNDVSGFRDRMMRCYAKGITPIVFGHTDGTGWNVDQVKQFQRDYFPKIADITVKYSLGWEFDQIDGLNWTMDGYKQLDLFGVARDTLPNARRYGHWGPERWAGGPDRIGSYTKDEYAWWNEAKAKGAHGMLYNDNNASLDAAMERYHDISAPHGYGPGILGRMVGLGMDCVCFELSRGDLNRFNEIVRQVKADGRSQGWG